MSQVGASSAHRAGPKHSSVGLRIRPCEVTDAAAVHEAVISSRAELAPWMPWCTAEYGLEDARRWAQCASTDFKAGTACHFVVLSQGGQLLGACGLSALDAVNRRAELGYWVRSDCTGQGIATAAGKLLAAWAFANTYLQRMEILVSTRNVASQRVAERLGAQREALLRQRLCLPGGFHDAFLYVLLRDAG